MKGLLLAAGKGTRLRPLTSLRPKPVIAVANRPIILHAVDNLVEAGVDRIGVVVSPETLPYIKDVLRDYGEASIEFIVQDPPLGLAHAVKVGRDFLADDPFVMYLGDNLFEHGIKPVVDAYNPEAGDRAVLALIEVEDPRALGVAVVDGERITQLVEKPEVPPSNLAVAGVYVFDASIHEVVASLEPGAKNEYQITDAVQKLIEAGEQVRPVRIEGWWKDSGKPADILDANRLLLLKLNRRLDGDITDSEIEGDVVVERGARVCNSKLVGPVLVASGAVIEGAYVGPYTSIGKNVVIRDAEVEYAVIEEESKLEHVKTRLHMSLLGTRVEVSGKQARPKAHRLILGDESDVQLQE